MKVTVESHSLEDLSKGLPIHREEIEVADFPPPAPASPRRPRRNAAPAEPAEVDQSEDQEEADAPNRRT